MSDDDAMAYVLADFVMAVRLAQVALDAGDVESAASVLTRVVTEHPRASACFDRGVAMAMATLTQKDRGCA